MRKLALTAAVAAATLVSAPAADAHPTYHYAGGCTATAVSSDFSDMPTWTVSVDIVAMATDAITGAPAPVATTVECSLRFNGTWTGAIAVTQSHSPVGITAGHASTTVSVDFDDVVDICQGVTAGGNYHLDCAPVTFVHPDETACWVLPGDDVKVDEKIVYDCPAYDG